MVAENKKRVMITLTSENAKLLDELAKKMGVNKSALVSLWINSNKEQKK